jgi:hypothetical protein
MIAGFVQETMRLHAIFQVEFGRVCTITETAAMRRLLFFCRWFFFSIRSSISFLLFFRFVLRLGNDRSSVRCEGIRRRLPSIPFIVAAVQTLIHEKGFGPTLALLRARTGAEFI